MTGRNGTNLVELQGTAGGFRAFVVDAPFGQFRDLETGARVGTHCAVVTDDQDVTVPSTAFLGRGRLPDPPRKGVGYGMTPTEAARAAYKDFRKRYPEEPKT